MVATSRLGKQLEEVITSLGRIDARFALIGGLALAPHKVVRATQDIDILTEAEKTEDIHDALLELASEVSEPIHIEQPLVNDGGASERPATNRDPFEALDDLMVVVEALCPIWPTRDTFSSSSIFLL